MNECWEMIKFVNWIFFMALWWEIDENHEREHHESYFLTDYEISGCDRNVIQSITAKNVPSDFWHFSFHEIFASILLLLLFLFPIVLFDQKMPSNTFNFSLFFYLFLEPKFQAKSIFYVLCFAYKKDNCKKFHWKSYENEESLLNKKMLKNLIDFNFLLISFHAHAFVAKF